jgi:hypothetical protein
MITPAPRNPTPLAIAPSAAPVLVPPWRVAMMAKTQAAEQTGHQRGGSAFSDVGGDHGLSLCAMTWNCHVSIPAAR